MDDQRYGTCVSQENILKIAKLKRLLNKYPQYCMNADGILKLVRLGNDLATIPIQETTFKYLIAYPPPEDMDLNATLFSIQSQSTLVLLTRYDRVSFNISIFSPTGNQFDLLDSEMLSKSTLEATQCD